MGDDRPSADRPQVKMTEFEKIFGKSDLSRFPPPNRVDIMRHAQTAEAAAPVSVWVALK